MDRLPGKTRLITGFTGIAGAAAELFAAEGARVFGDVEDGGPLR